MKRIGFILAVFVLVLLGSQVAYSSMVDIAEDWTPDTSGSYWVEYTVTNNSVVDFYGFLVGVSSTNTAYGPSGTFW